MNVFSDVVITSGGVAAERKNVPDVLYFYARTYLAYISDTGYPVITFKSICRGTSTALQLLPKF